jgi:hypothetical protein
MRHSLITTSILAIAAVGVLGLTGCAEDRKPPPNQQNAMTNDVPDWVNDPTQGGKYLMAAYGVSEYKMAGEAHQRQAATQNAQRQIAEVLSTKIQAVFKNWTREGGEITSQDNRQMAMTMSEDIARSVTNQTLEGAVARARWVDPATKRLYLWMYIDPGQLEKMKAATAAAAREQMEKRAHFAAKIEADKAFADLDKLIEKEMGGK